MGNQLIRIFTNQKIVPALDIPHAEKAKISINLPPSVAYIAGSTLLLSTGTGTSAVQTVTAPGSLTYTLSGVNPLTGIAFTTASLAFGANDAAVQLALNNAIGLSGPGSVTVASLAVTFAGALAKLPIPLMTIATAGSGSPAVANTTPGVTPGTNSAYLGSSGTPALILEYASATDASGNVTLGGTSGGDEHGAARRTVSAYTRGYFNCADLSINGTPGIDANFLTAMKARLIQGTVTAGIVYIP